MSKPQSLNGHDTRPLICQPSSVRAALLAGLIGLPTLAGCGDSSPVPSAGATTAPSKIANEKVEASLAAIEQYMQTGEWVKAEAIIRTLLERAPNEPRAHEMMGQLLIQKAGDAEQAGDSAGATEYKKQAWKCYQDALRLDPDSAGLNHSAGLMAMTAGDSATALALFQKAESLDHTNPQFPLYAAQVLILQKNFADAEAALRRVLAIQADEPYAHASLAMIALERNQMDAALAEIRAARAVLPDDAGLRAQEAKVHRRRGETRQALELLIGMDEASRTQDAVTFEIAAAYEALNDPEKAAIAWALCARSNPRSQTAYLAAVHAGEMYLKAGNTPEAARWGNAAMELRPDAPEVKALMKQLHPGT